MAKLSEEATALLERRSDVMSVRVSTPTKERITQIAVDMDISIPDLFTLISLHGVADYGSANIRKHGNTRRRAA